MNFKVKYTVPVVTIRRANVIVNKRETTECVYPIIVYPLVLELGQVIQLFAAPGTKQTLLKPLAIDLDKKS